VSGNGSFTILGVQHRLNYLEEKQDRTEVAALKERIEALEADIDRENTLLAVQEKEDARLAKNDVVAGDQGLALEQLRGINDYLLGRQEAIALKRLERKARIKELNEQLNKLRLQLNQVQGRKARATSEVVVDVSANSAVEAALTLKYMVHSAGWGPSYDIRVADITRPLQLTYKAQVYQSTGEEWKDVELALSSGQPARDATMPELDIWRLDFGRPARTGPNDQAYNANVRDVRGIVRDARTGEPLPFITVALLDASGNTLNGATSNVDGYYAIAIPTAGRSLQFTYVGYQSQNVGIYNGTINVNMALTAMELKEVQIVTGGAAANYADRQSGVVRMSRFTPSRAFSIGKGKRRQREEFGEDELEDGIEAANTSLAASAVQRTTSFEFPISVPYTIPSDGQNHQVGVQEHELKSTYRYYCTPKLDFDAFLFAQVTGWESMNLLAGPAYIYFEGTYVGESLLDLGGVGDTLDISLGRDKGVSVQRTKRKDFSRRQVSGSKRTESVGWEIAVRNNKAQSIAITITDQYPVAVRSEIEVRLDDSGSEAGGSGHVAVNEENGFLTWKTALEPRTGQKWSFGYSVKVPKEQ
ncbi:MAG TPA: mucoidy inhibitor MuiA family protein, partial [Flavobacteriales bacterium]|nr:mucoidy inhibitor MuiA family protein [Flavobacteriales bacterium]